MTIRTAGTADAAPAGGAPHGALRYPAYRWYLLSRSSAALGTQITSVSVGWMVYERSHDPFLLGLVGLVQFLPSLLLALVTGQLADRVSRRAIVFGCSLIEALLIAGLLVAERAPQGSLWTVFAVLAMFGIARAIHGPAAQAMIANVTPPAALPSAIGWSSGAWQVAVIAGPAAGGLLYGLGPQVAFLAGAGCLLVASAAILFCPPTAGKATAHPRAGIGDMLEGLRYVLRTPVLWGAMTLDLFIVLLGGVTALLPVIALDILQAGPVTLGLLRAAPGLGGVAVALLLGIFPLRRATGSVLFVAVAVFGMATLMLAFTSDAAVAIALLAVIGASDMISVYIRSSVTQLATPDAMRGRVSALNMVSVGASNELGEFRAGCIAALVGTHAAIVLGGASSLLIAALWARLCRPLRRVDRLDDVRPG